MSRSQARRPMATTRDDRRGCSAPYHERRRGEPSTANELGQQPFQLLAPRHQPSAGTPRPAGRRTRARWRRTGWRGRRSCRLHQPALTPSCRQLAAKTSILTVCSVKARTSVIARTWPRPGRLRLRCTPRASSATSARSFRRGRRGSAEAGRARRRRHPLGRGKRRAVPRGSAVVIDVVARGRRRSRRRCRTTGSRRTRARSQPIGLRGRRPRDDQPHGAERDHQRATRPDQPPSR